MTLESRVDLLEAKVKSLGDMVLILGTITSQMEGSGCPDRIKEELEEITNANVM